MKPAFGGGRLQIGRSTQCVAVLTMEPARAMGADSARAAATREMRWIVFTSGSSSFRPAGPPIPNHGAAPRPPDPELLLQLHRAHVLRRVDAERAEVEV